jgi:hypothetical protein
MDELNQGKTPLLEPSYANDNEYSKDIPVNLIVIDKSLWQEIILEILNSFFPVPDNKKLTRKEKRDLLVKHYEQQDKINILKRFQ